MKLRATFLWLLVILVVSLVIICKHSSYSLFKFPRHARVRRNTSDQYVIYLCDGSLPCGGWADRQKGIVAGYVLAEMMGRRFRVKITKPCELNTHLVTNTKQWEVLPNELESLSVKYIRAIDKEAVALRQKMTTMNLTNEYTEDVIYFTSNMEYVQYLLNNSLYTNETEWMQHFTLSDLYVNILNKLFKLNTVLERRFSNFTESIPRKEGVQLVCAQVRLGKNPTVPKDSEVFNTRESVNSLWTFLAKYNSSEKYRMFVTSDSEDVRKAAREKFPALSVDVEGDIVHIERNVGANVCDGFSKVILDQLVLSTCDVLVLSRSGLGRIAAWFRAKSNDVYCFAKGKVEACDPYDLNILIAEW